MKKATMKAAVKKTALCLAMTAALGASAAASASTINFSFNGLFTMLSSTGAAFANTSAASNSWSGNRTDITGTMSFNTTTGSGTGTVTPFAFFNGSSDAVAQSINFQSIGNGNCTSTGCQPGTLVLGNMLFNWSGNNGIPVSIVLDASGLFTAMNTPGFGVGTTINQSSAGDVLPASNYMTTGAKHQFTWQIGAVPIATTTWNTTLIGAACTGTNGASCSGRNPSGGLPLIADTAVPANYTVAQTGIGGNPMIAGPFPGDNANFDITSMTVTSITGVQPVPVPAAVWLLGSGLLGLVGVARRKRSDQV
ncbi:MAG: VPLPA-CTERM sorting domain-containing protein [Gammaproteobacteria bacterium]|nr:VPLPA-CTERM sorting domain-containing protein [Gammaproteobacteria bacterium]